MSKINQKSTIPIPIAALNFNNTDKLLVLMNDTESWLSRLNRLVAASIKNIQLFSTDIDQLLTQFPEESKINEQNHCISQFGILMRSLSLQLIHFQKNSQFSKMEFQCIYSQNIKKFKIQYLQKLIQVKTNYSELELTARKIINQLLNLNQNLQSSNSSSFSCYSNSNKQNFITKKSDKNFIKNQNSLGFLRFVSKIGEQLQQSLKHSTEIQTDFRLKLNDLVFSINQQIILYTKKQHSMFSTLFKSLLQEVSTRFIQFKSSNIASVLSSQENIYFKQIQFSTSLQNYKKFVDNGPNVKINVQFLKKIGTYLSDKLSKRNSLFQTFSQILKKYVSILKNICKSEHKSIIKENLNCIRKYPYLIHQKTMNTVESLQVTSQCIFGIMEQLVKTCVQQLNNINAITQKIDYFIKNFVFKTSLIVSSHAKPSQILDNLLSFVTSCQIEQASLNLTFQNTISKVIQSLFVNLSEIQSRLLVIQQTYFGLGIKNTINNVKNWVKNIVISAISINNPKKTQQIVNKVNTLIHNLIGNQPTFLRKSMQNLTARQTLIQNQQRKLGQFYCIHKKDLGVLKVNFDFLEFVPFNKPSTSPIILYKSKIIEIRGMDNNTVNIQYSTSLEPNSFIFFSSNKLILYTLRSYLHERGQNHKRILTSQKNLMVEECLSSTLDNSESILSQDEYEEQIEIEQHLQEQASSFVQQSTQAQQISTQEQKQREQKLKDMTNCKIFENFDNFQLKNTNCMHLLDVLFGDKQYKIENKISRQFYYYFKDSVLQQNFKPQKWSCDPRKYFTKTNIKSETPLVFKRTFRFDHPLPNMGIPFLPKTCKSTQTQILTMVSKDKFIVDTEVESTGAPYTDTFKLKFRSLFTNKDNIINNRQVGTVKLNTMISMQWVKRTIMKSMVQKQAYGQTRMASEVYIRILNQAIKKYPLVIDQIPKPVIEPKKKTIIIKKLIKVKKNKVSTRSINQKLVQNSISSSENLQRPKSQIIMKQVVRQDSHSESSKNSSSLSSETLSESVVSNSNQCVQMALQQSNGQNSVQTNTHLLVRNYFILLIAAYIIKYLSS